jgi:nucleoside 2-deoxyribosyltransferase
VGIAGKKVFLAAPYSQWMNKSTGRVEEAWKTRLDGLRMTLINAGAEVFSAHHNESWGLGWLTAHECTPLDYQAMQDADLVCALVGSPASGGVTVELGWASAWRKPVLAVLDGAAQYTPLIDGLHTITSVEYVIDAGVWNEAFTAELLTALMRLGTAASCPVSANVNGEIR